MEDLKTILLAMARNAVRLSIGDGEGQEIGRFGGQPEVPPGFEWPYFVTDTFFDDEVKPRPLSFLAQFDCAALAELDADGLLPQKGVLSFFYEALSQQWGFDPEDAGCARVYWFPNKTALRMAAFPEDLEESCRFPVLPIRGRSELEYPSYEELSVMPELLESCKAESRSPWNVFGEVRNAMRGYKETPPPWHRLLGWPDILQGSMTQECELIRRGYSTGRGFKDVPPEILDETEKTAINDWRLLFQLDSGIQTGNFSLDFGDSGSIYFYIRKEDLELRRFDRIWLILQCC